MAQSAQGALGQCRAIGLHLEEAESLRSFEHRSDVITLAAAWKAGCKGENRSRENSEAADGSQTSRETMAA